MNDNPDLSPDDGDENLDEALAALRQVEPSLESRLRYRRVIATELARAERRESPAPRHWWNRSISVPVPVGLAMCILLAGILLFRGTRPDATGDLREVRSRETENTTADMDRADSPAISESVRSPHVTCYASETYLCGVGRMEYKTVYQVTE